MNTIDRIHKKCGKPMQPIPVRSNIAASEYYCHGCHHSETMPREIAEEILAQKEMIERVAAQARG